MAMTYRTSKHTLFAFFPKRAILSVQWKRVVIVIIILAVTDRRRRWFLWFRGLSTPPTGKDLFWVVNIMPQAASYLHLVSLHNVRVDTNVSRELLP